MDMDIEEVTSKRYIKKFTNIENSKVTATENQNEERDEEGLGMTTIYYE
jgi:hypothetical protein